MPGGILQLVFQGAQDIYLTGNPTITYFKTVYKRHSPFGTEYIPLYFDPIPSFTPTQKNRGTCRINRNADLVHDTYLEYDLPAIYTNNKIPFGWCESVGTKIIDETSIRFDGTLIDTQKGDYLKVYTDLSKAGTDRGKYNFLTGNISQLKYSSQNLSDDINTRELAILSYKLYIPFKFWFCNDTGSSIPLIALQYNEVYLDVTFNQLNDLFRIGNPLVSPQQLFGDYENSEFNLNIRNYLLSNGFDQTNVIYYFTNGNPINVPNIISNYIFLGDDERQMFAQTSHEYLITQTQYNLFQGLRIGPNSLYTNFSHPVIEIFWYLTKDDLFLRNDWYNFTGLTDKRSVEYYLENLKNYTIEYFNPSLLDYVSNQLTSLINATQERTVLNLPLARQGNFNNGYFNIMENFQPIFNNNDRAHVYDSNFYQWVSQYKYHTGISIDPVYVLSFGFDPEKIQPSGTQNFSRLDSQEFRLNIWNVFRVEERFNCHMYARNYNVLRIIGGIGSTVFAN